MITGMTQITGTLRPAHAVYTTQDEYGRRGALIGVYTTSAAAEKAAERAGWFNGKGQIDDIMVLITDTGEIYMMGTKVPMLDTNLPQERDRRRQAALDKLTPEDRELLGLAKTK